MNQWPTFDDDDDDSINHTDVKKRNGTKSSIKNVIYIPDNNYKKKKNNNIEDIIDIDNKKNKKLSEMEDIRKRKELFRELRGQVQSLGATQFRGWDKRDWIKKKEKSMGMKSQKNQKIPRKIMNGIKKKQNEKIQRREKEAKEADVVLGKYKKKRKGGRFDMKKKKRVSRR